MQSAFFIISIVGLLYFSLVKRQFDFFSLSYFSAIFYFSPGYMGYVPVYFMSQTSHFVRGVSGDEYRPCMHVSVWGYF